MVISILISIPIFGVGENQKPEWKGKIEYEKGVKVIKNPREPLYGEIIFNLEEDLSIGNEEDDNYIFYGLVMIAVDKEGNIFILDGGNHRIQKFDKNGKYLQTIGREGQGPGEFEDPAGMALDSAEDNIYIYDRYKLHIFDRNGKFKQVVKLPKFTYQFGITKDGNIIMNISSSSRRGNTDDIALVSPEGEIIKKIASFSSQLRPNIKGHILSNPYSHRLHFYPTSDWFGIYGHSSEYKLFVLNSSGHEVCIIEKDEASEPISKKEKERLIDRCMKIQKKFPQLPKLSKDDVKKAYIFPEFKPFFDGILTDDKYRIYIHRFKSPFDEDKSEYYDLFDKEGYFICRVKLPFSAILIRNGLIYTGGRDPETHYTKFVRYKIKNYDILKGLN